MAFYPAQLPAPLRRAFWSVAYQLMARIVQRADWRLMNYGFDPEDPKDRPALEPGDENDRTCIQLYHHVATRRPVEGRRVLEVGSGRGGGASYVARYLRPAEVVGMDRSPQAVALANRLMARPGLRYEVGDAEAIPLPDASFDVVLNVESCHCYGSVPKFLSEVKRVLRPGGHLLLTDLRLQERVAQLDQEMQDSGMVVEDRQEITRDVVRGLRADHDRRSRLIAESGVWGFRGALHAFAATEGSTTFRDLDNGTFRYITYALRKPE